MVTKNNYVVLKPLIKKDHRYSSFISSRPGTGNKKAPPIKSEELAYHEAIKAMR